MLIVLVSFFAVTTQAFAGKATGAQGEKVSKPGNEKSLFQRINDSIPSQDKTRKPTSHKVDNFRNAKISISSMDNSAKKAKALSLRNNRSELEKRRGIKK